jgi:hypothetical protein
LLDVTQTDSLADGDFAVICVFRAGKNPEQGGLARAVRTDQADAISLGNGKRDVLKEWIGSKSFGDAAYIN